jgi:ParB family chromosome partitioning protein
MLPEEILNGLSEGKLSEGHTRPLLMLVDKPEEQLTLFKEIVYKKLTVREAEAYARKIAQDKVRKKSLIDPELIEMENRLKESLGTRVSIEKRENGGRITIDYFTADDIKNFLEKISAQGIQAVKDLSSQNISKSTPIDIAEETPIDDRAPEEIVAEENTEELYSVKNFGV